MASNDIEDQQSPGTIKEQAGLTISGDAQSVRVLVYRGVSHVAHARMTKEQLLTAHPVYDSDPDDPVEILRALPEEHHAQFRTEYAAAVDGAQRPEQFRQLHELLRLWRLRAAAYSSPGYDQRLAAAHDGRATDFAPAGQAIPGWPGGRQHR